MKTRYKLLIFFAWLPVIAMPQASLDSVIAAVKAANPSLTASRMQMEAEMKAARTGIALPNPEVQFDYLWGDPASSGNRIDFGITQSFDFPSVYVQKASQSGLVKTGASLTYRQKEREMIYKARNLWITLVGINRQLSLFEHRAEMAGEIARKAKIQLSKGEIDVIRYHHALMESVNLKIDKTSLENERNSVRNQLVQLCGGKTVAVPDTAFPALSATTVNELIGSFMATPPVKILENDISIRNKDKSIAVSDWFPKFKAGYYSETVTGLRYQGITTGMSIPLFQNSNTVKTADLRMKQAEADLNRFRSEETVRIVSLSDKRDRLISLSLDLRSSLLPVGDVGLLKKALDGGEISISEFYYECSVFYTAWLNLIKVEEEVALADAELMFCAGR